MQRSKQCWAVATSMLLLAGVAGCGGDDDFSADDAEAWCDAAEAGVTSLQAAEDSALGAVRIELLLEEWGELDWPPEIEDDFEIIREGEPDIFDYESDEGDDYEAAADRYFAAGDAITAYMVDDCGLSSELVMGGSSDASPDDP